MEDFGKSLLNTVRRATIDDHKRNEIWADDCGVTISQHNLRNTMRLILDTKRVYS